MADPVDEDRPSPKQTAELLPKGSRRFWLDLLDILHVYAGDRANLLVTNEMWTKIVYSDEELSEINDPVRTLDRTWTRWKNKVIDFGLGKRAVWHKDETECDTEPGSGGGRTRVGVSMEVVFVREVCAEKLAMFKPARKSPSQRAGPVAKLVSLTPSAEKTMAYVARVSNPSNQDNEKIARLLRYCIKHQHWSVFEQASMTVEINTTRGIAAQILRHRSFTFQEFSQRYADASLLGEIPVPDVRSQDKKNRQKSIDDIPAELKKSLQAKIASHFRDSVDLYRLLLNGGVAKECARFVLPLATPTRLYMTGSVRSWIHYIELRSGHGTQKEHMEIAEAVRRIFVVCFPVVSEALGWGAGDG